MVVTSFPDRLVECSIEAVVNEWYEDWIRTVRSDALDEITCRSFSGDCRAPSCLYLSEPSCNATFYGMVSHTL